MKPTTAFAPLTGNDIESWASGMGLKLDAVQLAVLDPGIRRGILNCCRKFGKSMTIAFKAAHFAYSRPNTTVLVVAAAARQSEELLATIGRILRRYVSGCSYSRVRIDLPNGSRILALPNQPDTIRGYSPELVVVDEAAYVDDDLWEAVFPMLNAAEGGGWLWLLSTPAQPAGFFHRIWTDTSANWTRVKVAAPDCARIPARMIEEARRSMPAAEFAREYLCEFAQPATAAFEEPLVQACLDPTLTDFFTTHLQYPLPAAPRRARPHAYVGVDLGRQQDHSAMAIVEFVTEPTGSVHAETRAALFRCSLTLRHPGDAGVGDSLHRRSAAGVDHGAASAVIEPVHAGGGRGRRGTAGGRHDETAAGAGTDRAGDDYGRARGGRGQGRVQRAEAGADGSVGARDAGEEAADCGRSADE